MLPKINFEIYDYFQQTYHTDLDRCFAVFVNEDMKNLKEQGWRVLSSDWLPSRTTFSVWYYRDKNFDLRRFQDDKVKV